MRVSTPQIFNVRASTNAHLYHCVITSLHAHSTFTCICFHSRTLRAHVYFNYKNVPCARFYSNANLYNCLITNLRAQQQHIPLDLLSFSDASRPECSKRSRRGGALLSIPPSTTDLRIQQEVSIPHICVSVTQMFDVRAFLLKCAPLPLRDN